MIGQLFDMPVHPIDYQVSVERVRTWIHQRQRPAAFIVQTNAYSLVAAQEDPEYAEALQSADLSVPDGMPLVWLLRMKGHSVKARVYGPDLMLMLCEEGAKLGWRCFLYGGKPGTPELLRDELLGRFPSLNVVGAYSPPFGDLPSDKDEEITAMINHAKPDIVWVALGGPKQDLWMLHHRDKLDVSVMHGVGAAFDFITDQVRQAPRWMMNSGLEWLFRLYCEPRRLWKRYTITNLKFFYYLVTREVVQNLPFFSSFLRRG